MPQPNEQQRELIERFVAKLWQHVRLRALEVTDPEALRASAGQVSAAFREIENPVTVYLEIGERLAGCILRYTIELAREHCISCMEYANCLKTDTGPCDSFKRDMAAYETTRAVMGTAIMMLDGAYGVRAKDLLPGVFRYLDIQVSHCCSEYHSD